MPDDQSEIPIIVMRFGDYELTFPTLSSLDEVPMFGTLICPASNVVAPIGLAVLMCGFRKAGVDGFNPGVAIGMRGPDVLRPMAKVWMVLEASEAISLAGSITEAVLQFAAEPPLVAPGEAAAES